MQCTISSRYIIDMKDAAFTVLRAGHHGIRKEEYVVCSGRLQITLSKTFWNKTFEEEYWIKMELKKGAKSILDALIINQPFNR